MQSDGFNSALSPVVYCAEYKNKYTNTTVGYTNNAIDLGCTVLWNISSLL